MDPQGEDDKDRGIFLSRGVSLRLRGHMRITFGPDDQVTTDPIGAELSLSMTPFWLEIALGHLAAAERAHGALLVARDADDEPAMGQAVEDEFVAGMQTIVAAVTALDALYASVKPHVGLSAETIQTWRDKRTTRHAQVAEVLRRGLALDATKLRAWRKLLAEVYRFRGWAVHPSSAFTEPVKHPDLPGAVARVFVAFRYENARAAVRAALAIAALVASKSVAGRPKALAEFCRDLGELTAPACGAWRAKYGRLTDDDALERQTGSGG